MNMQIEPGLDKCLPWVIGDEEISISNTLKASLHCRVQTKKKKKIYLEQCQGSESNIRPDCSCTDLSGVPPTLSQLRAITPGVINPYPCNITVMLLSSSLQLCPSLPLTGPYPCPASDHPHPQEGCQCLSMGLPWCPQLPL